MSGPSDPCLVENLCRWKRSGEPRRWVEARQGRWDHADWLRLLAELRQSAYWPLDPDAAGSMLEDLKRRWWNLRRWQEAGLARAWVAAHHGFWTHDDWVLLLTDLAASEFWPLCPEAVGEVLEEARVRWWNLQRWRESDQPRQWVKDHEGRWNHDDWLRLLADLERSSYGPLDPVAVGALLEKLRDEWAIVRRWQDPVSPRPRPAPVVRRPPVRPVTAAAPAEGPVPMRRKLFQAACERVKHLLAA